MARDNELITFLGFSLSPDSLHHVETYTKMVASAQRAVLQFAGVVAGIQLTRYFGAQMNAMKNAAEMTGVSTERLQEWQYAAAKVGVATDAVVNDFKKLTATMASPIPGQFNKNLAMMGVSVYKAKGGLKTADELFGSIADKMSKMSVQRSMQWGKLIGISPETVLLLRQGREALEAYREESRLAIVSDASLDAMARFHREINTLALITKKWSVEFMAAVSNPLIKMVKNIKEWFKLNDEFLRGTQLNATKQLMWAYSDLTKELQALINTFGFLGPAMDKASKFVKNSLDEGGFSDLVVLFTMFAGGKLFGRLGGKLIGGKLGRAREMRKFVRSYDALPATEQAFIKAPTRKMRKEAAYATKFDFSNSNLLKIAMLGSSFLIGGGKFIAVLGTALLALDLFQAIVTDNKTLFGELYKAIDSTEEGHKLLTAAANALKVAFDDLKKTSSILGTVFNKVVSVFEKILPAFDTIVGTIKSMFDWHETKDAKGNVIQKSIGQRYWENQKKQPFWYLRPANILHWAFAHALTGVELNARTGNKLAAQQQKEFTDRILKNAKEGPTLQQLASFTATKEFYIANKLSKAIQSGGGLPKEGQEHLDKFFNTPLTNIDLKDEGKKAILSEIFAPYLMFPSKEEWLSAFKSALVPMSAIKEPFYKSTREDLNNIAAKQLGPVSPVFNYNFYGPVSDALLEATQQSIEYTIEGTTKGGK